MNRHRRTTPICRSCLREYEKTLPPRHKIAIMLEPGDYFEACESHKRPRRGHGLTQAEFDAGLDPAVQP